MKVLAVLLSGVAMASAAVAADSVVAQDGSGQFKTIQAAVDAAPAHLRKRFVVQIKPGRYAERVVVPPEKTYLTFEGDDAGTTIITAGVHAGMPGPDGRPLITFGTPTVFIQANDFTAENLTFENSAGPQGQALALTIMSDRGVFRNCRFLGYQDTLLAQAGRQYFDHCYIEGAVDFIFGGSTAWFEACEIHVTANGYITAPNTPRDQHYGYVFSKCKITGEPNVRTFLGRPWRPYGSTAFLNTEMSAAVRAEGWDNWNDPARERTARFAEYHSTGEGAGPTGRRSWGHQLTDADLREYTAESVLAGIDGWNPLTGSVRSAVTITKAEGAGKAASIARDTVWLATAGGTGPGDGLHLAYTTDGYKWTAITGPVMRPEVGQKQIIDPRLVQGPDGTFYLLWATGLKGDKGFGCASSKDLEHWSGQHYVEIMARENALDLASPSVYYDEVGRWFVVTWSSTISKNFIQSFQEEVEENPRIWYATTRDFENFSDPQVFFDPNYSVRDGHIVENGGRYVLVHNDNTRPMLDLRVSAASTPFGPWGPSTDAFTAKFTARPAAIRSGNECWIYFSNTATGEMGLVKTRDFRTFQDASTQVSFPAGMQPAGILAVPRALVDRLKR